jgi:hypothetical protein
MSLDPTVKQSFIDYLERHLCDASMGARYRFTKVGPHSFLYRDERDTLFVKVSGDNLILILDGDDHIVADHMEMLYLALQEEDEEIFDHYLQEILHKL